MLEDGQNGELRVLPQRGATRMLSDSSGDAGHCFQGLNIAPLHWEAIQTVKVEQPSARRQQCLSQSLAEPLPTR